MKNVTVQVARWESKSGKHWANLSCDDFGWHYKAPGARGSLGHMTLDNAMRAMQGKVDAGYFQPDDNVTPMRLVTPWEGVPLR